MTRGEKYRRLRDEIQGIKIPDGAYDMDSYYMGVYDTKKKLMELIDELENERCEYAEVHESLIDKML